MGIFDFFKENKEEKYKKCINLFAKEMEKIPDWYTLVQAKAHAMIEHSKSENIKIDNHGYWARREKETNIHNLEEGLITLDSIKTKYEMGSLIVSELEKVIKKAAELKFNLTNELYADYCAARALTLGSQVTISEVENGQNHNDNPKDKSNRKQTYIHRSGESGEVEKEIETAASMLGLGDKFYNMDDWGQIKTLVDTFKSVKEKSNSESDRKETDKMFGTWLTNEFRFTDYSFTEDFKLSLAKEIFKYYNDSMTIKELNKFFDENVICKDENKPKYRLEGQYNYYPNGKESFEFKLYEGDYEESEFNDNMHIKSWMFYEGKYDETESICNDLANECEWEMEIKGDGTCEYFISIEDATSFVLEIAKNKFPDNDNWNF